MTPPFDIFESFEDSEGQLSVDLDEEGLVESILCGDTLTYAGQELIGRSEKEVIEVLGSPDEVGEIETMLDGTEQTPWFYEKMGLTLSFENRVSVSATVSEPDFE